MLSLGTMFLTIDIGSSSYRGHIITPSEQYMFERLTDRSNYRTQAYFREGTWRFDPPSIAEIKKHKSPRVYDIRDTLRLLNHPEGLDEGKIKKRWSFVKSVDTKGQILLDIGSEGHFADARMSRLLTDLLAFVLEKVLNDLNTLMLGVCYVVPYDYSKPAIEYMKEAIDEAQISSIQLVDERFATLLPYLYYGGIDRQDSVIFLTDYGDSCTTLSLARVFKGRLSFLASKSCFAVSGKQIDRLLLKYVMLKYKRFTGSTLLKDVPDTTILLAECEQAKISLSVEDAVDVQLSCHGGKRDVMVRRQEFETLLLLPLRMLARSIRQVLREGRVRGEAVDSVIAVGGNVRIPAVSRLLLSFFPYADHAYSRTLSDPSTLGGSLLVSNKVSSFTPDPWCYRVYIDDQHYILVGKSLQTLTRDIFFYPIPFQKKGAPALVKIIVERCKETMLGRALATPYKEAKEAHLWEYVFGYHYLADPNAVPRRDDCFAPPFGASNPFTANKYPNLEVLSNECLEIMAHFLQDGRIVVSISQVHEGRYVDKSTLRFSFFNGKVIEYLKPHNGVLSENRLFSVSEEGNGSTLTASSSLTASSVVPAVLNDRSTSVILSYSVAQDTTLAEEKKAALSSTEIFVSCPNRFLRVRTMPELVNVMPAAARPVRSQFSHITTASGGTHFLEEDTLPPFVQPLRSRQNERLFFVGPEPRSSPITACCYSGVFKAGKREGKGIEFSMNHSTVYQGDWANDVYHGEGTLWTSDGFRLECHFVNGFAEGEGRLFNREGAIVYEGGYSRGEKSGVGTEYQTDGTKYSGEFKHGLRHGKGVLTRENQCMYDGYWCQGVRQGKGKEVVGNTVYEGEFMKGVRHGQGVLSRLDGQLIYSGEWKWGKKNGEGKELFKGGIEYQGSYLDNRCEGKGKQFQNGVLLYEGEFVNGLREGEGVLYDDAGNVKMKGVFRRGKMNGVCMIVNQRTSSTYTGNVVDDVPNGKGEEKYKDGSYYVGEFKSGMRHGKGCYYNSADEIVYNGSWLYGLKHGLGDCHDEYGLYSGSFVRGKKEGQGVYTLYSGDQYKGEFADDLYSGRGVFTNVSGRVVYDGEWRNGQRHGEGKVFFGNGEYYQGELVHDMMCGKGICFYENGMPKYVGSFRNDLRNGEGVEYSINGEVLEEGYYVNNELIVSM